MLQPSGPATVKTMKKFKKTISVPILVSLMAIACIVSPAILNAIGGYRTIVLLAILGAMFGQYGKEDRPVFVALRHSMRLNSGMMLLLLWFYVAVVFSALRGGMGTLGEWKTFGVNILALFYGLFLSENPKYSRLLLFIVGPLIFFHALLSNEYVAATGHDLRDALNDAAVGLGHTNYWTMFVMLATVLMCQLLKEKNLTIKIIGFPMVAYLYATVMICGFATPVALFLAGHMVLGVVNSWYGKKGFLKSLIRIGLGGVLVVLSIWGAFKISTLEGDERFVSIQYRFKNMLENPEGGGYEVENSRFNLALISWDTFKKSPFFGCGGTYQNNYGSGGHQAFVDYLAIYGLFGAIPFIAFVFLCIANSYRRCKVERDWNAFASLACSVIFLLVGIVNPCWYGDPFTVLLIYAQPFKRSLPAFQRVPLPVFDRRLGGALPLPYSPYGQPFPGR